MTKVIIDLAILAVLVLIAVSVFKKNRNLTIVVIVILTISCISHLFFSKSKNENGGSNYSSNFDRVEEVVSVSNKYDLLLGIKKYNVKVTYTLMGRKEGKFYDVMEIDNERYNSPTERIVKTENGDYLVVRKLYASGTGMIQYNDVWYEIGADSYIGFSFNKVLEYAAEGHNNGTLEDNDLVLKTDASVINSGAGIKVDYMLEIYSNEGNTDRLIKTVSKKVLFEWNDDKREFVFDAKRSGMTEEAMLDILGLSK